MRLSVCSPQLGLSPTSVLGGEVYDREVLKEVARLGVNIEIILPKDRPYDKKIKNWRIEFLPITHIPAPLYNLLELPYLWRIYRHRPFQILRLHAPYFTGIGAWLFKLFHPQVKLVATYHQARRGFLYDLINKLLIHSWDAIVTDSQAAKQDLIARYHLLPSRLVAIPPGAPAEFRPRPKNKQLIKKLGLEHHVVLLFIGLLIPRKNPLFLIDVVRQLVKHRLPVKLIIRGDGPLKSQLVDRIAAANLQSRVIFYPPVFGQDKSDLYNLADIFVHPSLHEGFPLVASEALACGLPIVMSHAYSAPEIVTAGDNGFLARLNDFDDWTTKLTRLITNSRLRRKFSLASRSKYLAELSWPQAGEKHLNLFRTLLKSSGQ